MSRAVDLAFAAVLDCCRWPHGADRPAWLDGTGPDFWTAFGGLVRRHRVSGLAWRRVEPWANELPEALGEDLAGNARRIAADGLMQAAEALELAAALDTAGVTPLFLKGSSLEMLAYGRIGLKHASDIDVLVADEDLGPAGAVLRARSFQPLGAPHAATASADDPNKHDAWWHPTRGLQVELHARLVDNPRLLAGVGPGSPRQQVPLAGRRGLPTLSDEPLFAYLCVHGATHGWSRLKWLADLGAWLRPKPEDEVARLWGEAERIGAGRAAAQALLLGAALLDLPLAPALRSRLRRHPAHQALCRLAGLAMKGPRPLSELEDRWGGRVALHLSHFLLAPGARHGRAEMARKSRALRARTRGRAS